VFGLRDAAPVTAVTGIRSAPSLLASNQSLRFDLFFMLAHFVVRRVQIEAYASICFFAVLHNKIEACASILLLYK